MTLDNLEGLCRAIVEFNRGDPDRWRGIVELVKPYVPLVAPFLSPEFAHELSTLFSHDIGEGPTDPDPGF